MKRSNFALRLQPALLDEARKVAAVEGVALNQPINVAVAEKLSALRTEAYFAERAARANVGEAVKLLRSAGKDNQPMKRDEVERRSSAAASLHHPPAAGGPLPALCGAREERARGGLDDDSAGCVTRGVARACGGSLTSSG
jgi:hypothetical protein